MIDITRDQLLRVSNMDVPMGTPFGGPAYGEKLWVPAAIIAGGAIGSALLGNKGAKETAKASRDATKIATAEQRRQFDLTRSDTANWRFAGKNALRELYSNVDSTGDVATRLPLFSSARYKLPSEFNSDHFEYASAAPSYESEGQFNFDLQADPGYNFAINQAADAVNRRSAASGQRLSGNVLAELNDRATGVASQYANDAFNRQLSQSNTNYDRTLRDYGVDYQREQDMYGRARSEDELNYGRDLNDYNLAYQRKQDQYQRGLTDFNIDYQREADIYGRGQQRLNWLSTIAGYGSNANALSAQSGSNMANAIGNAQMANAQNQGNAAAMRYGAWNNALQGGISNYLAYNQAQQNNTGRSYAWDNGSY